MAITISGVTAMILSLNPAWLAVSAVMGKERGKRVASMETLLTANLLSIQGQLSIAEFHAWAHDIVRSHT